MYNLDAMLIFLTFIPYWYISRPLLNNNNNKNNSNNNNNNDKEKKMMKKKNIVRQNLTETISFRQPFRKFPGINYNRILCSAEEDIDGVYWWSTNGLFYLLTADL